MTIKVVLRGWRYFKITNVSVLAVSVFAPFAANFFVGWWLAALAVAWLGYAVWTLTLSALTEIVFGAGEITIHGQRFAASDLGQFEARVFDDGEGMDEGPGRIEIWVTHNGASSQMAHMSGHADSEAIGALLIAKLDAAINAFP